MGVLVVPEVPFPRDFLFNGLRSIVYTTGELAGHSGSAAAPAAGIPEPERAITLKPAMGAGFIFTIKRM